MVGPKSSNNVKPEPLILCDTALPFVEKCDHLGHTLSSDCTMEQDSKEKRAAFIDKSVKIREMFSFAHPSEQILAMEKYCLLLWKHPDENRQSNC